MKTKILILFLIASLSVFAQKPKVDYLRWKPMTTTERNALTPAATDIFEIYNQTTLQFEYWDGDSWEVVSSSSGTTGTLDQVLNQGNTGYSSLFLTKDAFSDNGINLDVDSFEAFLEVKNDALGAGGYKSLLNSYSLTFNTNLDNPDTTINRTGVTVDGTTYNWDDIGSGSGTNLLPLYNTWTGGNTFENDVVMQAGLSIGVGGTSLITTTNGHIEDDIAAMEIIHGNDIGIVAPSVHKNSNEILSNGGNWNASTNTPTLDPTDTNVEGVSYKVTAAGTFDGVSYSIGDIIDHDGTSYYKRVDNNQSGGSGSSTASDITTDDSTYDVLTGTNVDAVLVSADNEILDNASDIQGAISAIAINAGNINDLVPETDLYSASWANNQNTTTKNTLYLALENISSGGTANPLIDDDTFGTATDSNVASAESIKAYVDDTVASVSGGSAPIGDIESGETSAVSGDAVYYAINKYPFAKDVNVSIQEILDSVLDVEIVDAVDGYTYQMHLIQKAQGGSTWRFMIRTYDETSTLVLTYQWYLPAYTPTNDIERVKLVDLTDGIEYIYVTVDWTKLTDGASYNNIAATIHEKCKNNALDKTDLLTVVDEENIFDLLLPSTIRMLTGKELYLYESSIIYNYSVFEREGYFIKSNEVGAFQWRPSFLLANQTREGYVRIRSTKYLTEDNRDYPYIFQKYTKADYNTALTSQSVNLLTVADSYFDEQWGDGLQEYLEAFGVEHTNTFNFKGTRTSHGYLGENRAGWTAEQYVTQYVPTASREAVNGSSLSANMSSPFMFSTDDTVANSYFSFSEYLTTNSITDVDNVVLFLGTNNATSDASYLNTLVNGIVSALPSANIFIGLIPPKMEDFKTLSREDFVVNREDLNRSYLELFDTREAENIYLIPFNANFHKLYSYESEEIDYLQFQNGIEDIKKTITNSVHPNASGAEGMSYVLYNTLINVISE